VKARLGLSFGFLLDASKHTMRKTLASLFVVSLVSLASLATQGCSLSAKEAVELAIEGDKARGANLDDAISKYDQATQIDPTNTLIHDKLLNALKKKEDWAKLVQAASRAEKADPTRASAFYMHGFAARQLAEKGGGPAQWSDAREPLEQAFAKDPNLADAEFDLAEVLLNLDDETGALKAYTKAIETNPENTTYYGFLAVLYRELGYNDLAEKVVRSGLPAVKAGDKASFTLHSLLGDLMDKKSDNAAALSEFGLAKQACGECTDPLKGEHIAFFNLGRLQVATGDTTAGLGNLKKFNKLVCKSAMGLRYKNQCEAGREIATKGGGSVD
jgi:tetratricopeptide (TPR) repeat protein